MSRGCGWVYAAMNYAARDGKARPTRAFVARCYATPREANDMPDDVDVVARTNPRSDVAAEGRARREDGR